jgi:hypothetical protein
VQLHFHDTQFQSNGRQTPYQRAQLRHSTTNVCEQQYKQLGDEERVGSNKTAKCDSQDLSVATIFKTLDKGSCF